MLIRNAEMGFGTQADIRIAGGLIAEIGRLARTAGELEIDAGGCAVLPGLHDHHFHLLACAAARDSVMCGPPAVTDAEALAETLRDRAKASPRSWIRGVAYHESVAGEIDRDWLDRVLPRNPVRIQHRSGRLWVLNSRALEIVGVPAAPGPLEIVDGRPTGRLYDGDGWLRERIGSIAPPIRPLSEFLLSRGITGITDTTPGNGPGELALLGQARRSGALLQDMLLMGGPELDGLQGQVGIGIGARKFHLHEADLPDAAELVTQIRQAHAAGRPAAFHCVTLVELVFALGTLDDAGTMPGDRLEHAAIAPPEVLPWIARLGLTVVSQPNFIAERGDAYLSAVDPADRPWLYRQRGFREAGIRLAAGSDAPFGNPDPWKGMHAAVTRLTCGDAVIGAEEGLAPEEAVALFLGAADDPGGASRAIRPGAVADLCLIDRPWREARRDLSDVQLNLTIKDGQAAWRSGTASIPAASA